MNRVQFNQTDQRMAPATERLYNTLAMAVERAEVKPEPVELLGWL